MSDADEELLILIEFKHLVSLKLIKIYALNNDHNDASAPKQINIYKLNNLNINFDDMQVLFPDTSIKCATKKLKKGQSIKLQKQSKNILKFKQTKYLAIYIASNQLNTVNTYINSIEFKGTYTGQTKKPNAKIQTKLAKKKVQAAAEKKINEEVDKILTNNPHKIDDFSIFEHDSMYCFKSKQNSVGIVSSCSSLRRGSIALKYYHVLCRDDNEENKTNTGEQIFADFCIESYLNYLDDYSHIIQHHGDDLLNMALELRNYYGFENCVISECRKVRRHYNPNIQIDKNDDNTKFYTSYFDQLHHFIFHLFEMGLRIEINNNKYVADMDEIDYSCVDDEFQRRKDLIRSRRKKSGLHQQIMERYNNQNNRYNMHVDDGHGINHNESIKGYTFLDGMARFIQFNENMTENELYILREYVVENEYDSDAVKQDLSDLYSSNGIYGESELSNIYNKISNKLCIELMVHYIRNIHLSTNSFSTGYIFYYWDHQRAMSEETVEEEDQNHRFDLHNGHSIDELLVLPYYSSLKAEILSSYFLSLKQWNQKVVFKANAYLKTTKIKQILSRDKLYVFQDFLRNRGDIKKKRNKHDINPGQPILSYHLQCIILYCDWSKLCTEFSATFRKKHEFEPLQLLKARHSKYYYFSKGLVEIVNDFGIDGLDGKDMADALNDIILTGAKEGERFYCGLSAIMNVPSFAIHLKGPCSTTKDIQVSINFAKREGIIMQLQNDIASEGKRCRFWDCSWTSTYAEENERLFISEKYRMRIQSIRIINTNQNFELFFHSFHLFDSIISGVKLNYHLNVLKTDFKILNKMISNKLGKTNHKFDPYIQNVFSLFLSTKKRIRINMLELHKYGKKISNLIMHSVEENDYGNIDPNSYCNVIRSDIISIFPYIEEIVIYTSGCEVASVHFKAYRFSIKSFVSCIELINRPKLICRIFAEKDQYGYSWLYWLAIKDSNTWRISLTLDFMENDQHVLMVKHKI
eukprot:279301_1